MRIVSHNITKWQGEEIGHNTQCVETKNCTKCLCALVQLYSNVIQVKSLMRSLLKKA